MGRRVKGSEGLRADFAIEERDRHHTGKAEKPDRVCSRADDHARGALPAAGHRRAHRTGSSGHLRIGAGRRGNGKELGQKVHVLENLIGLNGKI